MTVNKPSVNWGDLFFDVFYVAAAFNLSVIIKSDPSSLSLLYVMGCLFAIFHNFWQQKLMYDSRFQTPDDIFHVGLEILQLVCLATAILHIRPVEDMSNVKRVEMFAFCVANLLTLPLSAIRIIETGLICVGQTEVVRYVAVTDFLVLVFSNLIVMMPATLLSGVLYFKNHDSNDHSGYDHDEIDDDIHDRYLAGAEYSGIFNSESHSVNHWPIILCFSILYP